MKTVKSKKVKIKWDDEIPSDLENNTVYIQRKQIIINKICCNNSFEMNNFVLDFDKESALIKNLIICPECKQKYFIAKGRLKSNHCPTANFVN